jgi:hypothetical protein
VLVGEDHTIELLRRDAALLQAQNHLACAQPAIDENPGMTGCNKGAVPRAPAAEHGQAEHGSQDSRVIGIYAN